jgi:DNA-binding SARP family transcriptional activator/DNA-binding beta-propeller fold protein YncE
MTVTISVLGPVEAARDGNRVDLGAPQQRALLALLATSRGPASLDTIIDTLWPDDPPASAAKVVQTYVSRLRKALGEDAIERRGGGYALTTPPSSIDAMRFEQLAREGAFPEALALWRGPALADLGNMPGLAAEAARLDEERLGVLEQRIDADIAAGRQAEVIGELRTLVSQHPLRDRFLGQLMLALYGTGRQAEALEVYRDARRRFDGLGLEPAQQLRELERKILEQDEQLPMASMRGDAAAAGSATMSRRRPVAVGVVLIALLTVAVVAAVFWFADGTSARIVSSAPNTIVRIDAKTSKVVESIPVGRNPSSIAATAKYVWVVNDTDGTLSRVDTSNKHVETIGRLPEVGIVTTDERGYAYVSGFDDALVSQVDPESLRVVKRYSVESVATGLAVGGGSLWVVDRLVDEVKRVDLATGAIEGTFTVGADPIFAAFGYGALWVVNTDGVSVSVIRPGLTRVQTISVPSRPLQVAVGESGVWVADWKEGAVTRIDPDTRRVVDKIDDPKSFGFLGVAAGGGAVWLASPEFPSQIVRINPRTNRVTAHISIDGSPRGITAAGDQIWVSVSEVGGGN